LSFDVSESPDSANSRLRPACSPDDFSAAPGALNIAHLWMTMILLRYFVLEGQQQA